MARRTRKTLPTVVAAGYITLLVSIACLVILVLVQMDTIKSSSDRQPKVKDSFLHSVDHPSMKLNYSIDAQRLMSIDEVKEFFINEKAGDSSDDQALLTPTDVPDQGNLDLMKLCDMTLGWEYEQYMELGTDKIGVIKDTNDTGGSYKVKVGDKLKGVSVVDLSQQKATLGYGNAIKDIRRVDYSFSGEERANPLPNDPETEAALRERYKKEVWEPTWLPLIESGKVKVPPTKSPEEQAEAYQKYMETVYNENLEKMKIYTPRPGDILPQPKSEQEIQEAQRKFEEGEQSE